MAITSSRPESLDCVGDRTNIKDMPSVKYYNSIGEVPGKDFDIIILDEPSFLTGCKSLSEVKTILSGISEVIREDGSVLIRFPDTLVASLRCRYWVERTLSHYGFNQVSYFLCDPSAEQPLTIIPYGSAAASLAGSFVNITDSRSSLLSKMKEMLKRVIFRTSMIYNPFRGLVLVGRKDVAPVKANEGVLESVQRELHGKMATKATGPPFVSLVDRGWKHLVFIHDGKDGRLNFIAKIGHKATRWNGAIRNEYENLTVLSRCKPGFSERKINIPEPIHYEGELDRSWAVQSAVPGVSVKSIIERYMREDDRKGIMWIVGQLIEMQKLIQKTCTEKLVNDLPMIRNDYFHNYLGVQLDFEKGDSELFSDQVQHGDFGTVNVFHDARTGEWGVIDWEGMASGYPPMLDVFCCITSVGFVMRQRGRMREDEGYMDSFIDTYFRMSWFSEYLNELVKGYCDYFHLERRAVFRNFTAYLLYQCNRYRLKEKYPPYQRRYEKMLIYAVENEENFAVQ